MGSVMLLVGCAADGDGDLEPSPYIYDEPDAPAPELDAADLADAIASAFATLDAIDTRPWYAAYLTQLDWRTGDCPLTLTDFGGDYADGQSFEYWQGDCTTDDGAAFEGRVFHYEWDDVQDDEFLVNGYYVDLSGAVETPDGLVTGAGAVGAFTGEGPVYNYWQQIVEGTFTWSGQAADGTWLEEGSAVRPTIARVAIDAPPNEAAELPNGARVAQIEGGITGLPGDLDTVSFSGVQLFTGDLGACPDEPSGTVSVRDDAGNWYDIEFHGPVEVDDDSFDPAKCDGCGDAWYRGELVGTTCVDFSTLVSWDQSPW